MLTAAILTAGYLLLVAAVEAFVLDRGSLLDRLVPPEPAALLFRGLHVAMLVGVGLVLHGVLVGRRRTAQALCATESLYRTLAESSLDCIFIVNRKGVVEYVNSHAASHWNASPDELVGKRVVDLFGREAFERQANTLMKVFETGQPLAVEDRMVFPARDAWLHTQLVPLPDGGGVPGAVLGISRDITERRLAEERLRASEEKYQHLFGNALVGLYRSRLDDGLVLECNERAAAIMGFPNRRELLASGLQMAGRYADPADRERVMTHLRKTGRIDDFEVRFMRRDGAVFWARFSARLDRERGYVEGVVYEITAAKEAEELLRESEANFKALAENASDGIAIATADGRRLVYANRRLSEITGYGAAALLQTDPACLVDPDQPEAHLFKGIHGLPARYEAVLRHKSGQQRTVEVTNSQTLWRGHQACIAFVRDITDRKRFEEKLWIKDFAIESSINAVAMANLEGDVIYINTAFLEMWGYENDTEILHQPLFSFWQVEECGLELVHELTENGSWSGDLVAVRKDGVRFDVHLSASLSTDENDQPLCLMASFVDITERKAAERAVREKEARLRELTEALPEAIFEMDLDAMLTYVNRVGLQAFGYTREELERGILAWNVISPEDRERVQHNVARILKGEMYPGHEYIALRKDGSTFPAVIYSAPITGSDGRPVGLRGFVVDITEQKKAEQAIKESEAKLRELTESLPETIFEIDVEGTFTYVNQAGLDAFRYLRDDINLRVRAVDAVAPRDRDKIKRNIARILAGEEFENHEYLAMRKDGTTFPAVIHSKRVIRDGRVVGIRGFVLDITDRKRAEAALRESEQRYRSLVETSPDAISLVDLQGHFITVNLQTALMHGFTSPEEMLAAGRNVFDLIAPEDRARAEQNLRKTLETGSVRNAEYLLLRKDGGTFPAELSASAVCDAEGRPTAFIGVTRDVTRRKHAQRAIKESEERLRGILMSLHETILIGYDRDGRHLFAWSDPELQRRYGETRRIQPTGQSIHDFLPPQEAAERLERIRRVFDTGESHRHVYPLDRPAGRFWHDASLCPLREPDGQVTAVVAFLRDITEAKKVEEALRYRREMEKLIASISTSFISLAPDAVDTGIDQALTQIGRLTSVDRAYVFLFSEDGATFSNTHEWCAPGVSPEIEKLRDLQTQDYSWIVDRIRRLETVHVPRIEDLPDEARAERTVFQSQRIRSLVNVPLAYSGAAIGFLGFDSVHRPVSWMEEDIALLKMVGEIFANAVARRRTERRLREHRELLEELVRQRTSRVRELERQRTESEKLAATGRMAARIAHEINNPLAGIKNSFLLIRDAVPDSHPHFGYVQRIENEINRISRIVRQMFDLYRPDQAAPRRFSVEQVIRDIVMLLEPTGRERRVALEVAADQAPAAVTLPEDLLRQVLYNIVINAIEASPAGGTIRIAASAGNGRLLIAVTDEGPGIPPDLRDRIFEPFFTTKDDVAKSLGLGLSISKSIAEAMHGSLSFQTEDGGGTTFRIELPMAVDQGDGS